MTQQDPDREALPSEAIMNGMADTWAERTGIAEKLKTIPSNLPTEKMQQRHDALVLRHVKLSYEEGVASGWQASAAYYAPLTEKEAARLVATATLCSLNQGFDAIDALRAAGVRFREEA
jgi:hypothetical protein